MAAPVEGHLVEPLEHLEPQLAAWEQHAVDAVGNVIEFWGFKRNQGRVWALLYLRGAALSAPELQAVLGLSKGAVSMITRELEQWQVVRRVREPNGAIWRFAANEDLFAMLNRVLESRELAFLTRVRADLELAAREVEAAHAPDEVVARVQRMQTLATLVERALRAFLRTARLDIRGLVGVLQSARRSAERS
ncbi:MAG: transcriptional regulator [Myxococcales bacterium]|nr:transcriptional regulator [Myxococcales bacterium]MCB9530304.1 transcriptional regulator [Myxococcales bacterium]